MSANSIDTSSVDAEIDRQIRRNKIISGMLIAVAVVNIAIIVWIAGMIGQQVGVLIALVIILSWVGISYLIYYKRVLSSTRSREPDAGELRRLQPMLSRLGEQLGVSEVRLRVIDDGAANAFAVGSGSKATVVFSTGLLGLLNDDELEGVVAHEMAHIANGDTRIALYSASLLGWALAVSVAAGVLAFALVAGGIGIMSGGDDRDDAGSIFAKIGIGAGMIAAAALMFVAVQIWFIVSKIAHMSVFRQREWIADSTAVKLTGKPMAMAHALVKINNAGSELTHGGSTVQALCILDIPRESWWERLFATHPDIRERVKRLQQYAGEKYYQLD